MRCQEIENAVMGAGESLKTSEIQQQNLRFQLNLDCLNCIHNIKLKSQTCSE